MQRFRNILKEDHGKHFCARNDFHEPFHDGYGSGRRAGHDGQRGGGAHGHGFGHRVQFTGVESVHETKRGIPCSKSNNNFVA